MFERALESYIRQIMPRYKAITLLGPRQSGKTTLAKKMFSSFKYVSLENPDQRSWAQDDPRGFLNSAEGNLVIDEVQKVPSLLSYLQEILDDKKDQRIFILTGSDSLLLSDRVSQSLAGRTRILNVFPMFRQELPVALRPKTLNETMWHGSYPRIFDEGLNPREWYADYYQTYVEKDVRNILAIENLAVFDRMVRLCAGRAGQITSFSAIGSEAGVSQPTVASWISVLQTSFIVFLLQPHFKNFSKRLIKSPKLYFYDTGLLCYLLRIRTPEDLASHPLRGAIFENWVISERIKQLAAKGEESAFYFWRDQHGHEVDLVEDHGKYLDLTEIKSGETFLPEFADHIEWLNKLQKRVGGTVIYGGDTSFQYGNCNVLSWNQL